jgi:hypothetical protein
MNKAPPGYIHVASSISSAEARQQDQIRIIPVDAVDYLSKTRLGSFNTATQEAYTLMQQVEGVWVECAVDVVDINGRNEYRIRLQEGQVWDRASFYVVQFVNSKSN